MEVRIDSDVPVPPRHYHVYPWERLKVGDSFGIADCRDAGTIRCLASRMGNKLSRKFSVRIMYGGTVRVWRVE
jgi:hypothetical protein